MFYIHKLLGTLIILFYRIYSLVHQILNSLRILL